MTIISKTKFLEFKSAKSPSGSDWYYVKRTNDKKETDSAVVITPIVKIKGVNHFLLLLTNRPPIRAENKAKYCLECPAGLIADDNNKETLVECTKKELLEETGFIPNKIFVELTNSSTSAGLSSETLSFVSAYINNEDVAQEPINDGGVIVKRVFVKTDEITHYIEKLDKNEVSVASPTLCAIFLAQNRLTKSPF